MPRPNKNKKPQPIPSNPHDKLLIIDFEATCWEHGLARNGDEIQEILEIGYSLVNFRSGVVEKNGGVIIKPSVSEISQYCTNLTSITKEQAEAEGSNSLKEGFDRIKEDVGSIKKYIWASWGAWDLDILRSQNRREGNGNPLSRYYLNLKAQYALHYGTKKLLSMEEALAQLGLPLEGTHHRGKDDTLNLAKIALEMYKHRKEVVSSGL